MSQRGAARGAPRGPVLRDVVLLVLLVLAGLLALLWLVGRGADRNHETAADAQLAADVQVARATFQVDLGAAAGRAATLARTPRVEAALARGDRAALRAVASAHPHTLLVAASGLRAGSLAPLGVTRTAEVVAGRTTIGRVVVQAPLDAAFLARARAGIGNGTTRDLLVVTARGRVAAGPLATGLPLAVPSPRDVRIAGRSYRALGSPLLADRPELRVVALTPVGPGVLAAWRTPLAVLATVLALGALAALAVAALRARAPAHATPPAPLRAGPPRRRAEERRPAGLELLGEQLAAAKDREALLRAVLDAAIEATGAAGGRVAAPDEPTARAGESGSDVLRVGLAAREAEGAVLLLYPPPGGFGEDAPALAHWLGTLASAALHDVGAHRAAEDPGATDELTGLASRRQFTSMLQERFARAQRRDEPLSVVLGDLDAFPEVTARLGREGADAALRAFAAAIRRCVRTGDVAARIGGETFGLLLPRTDAAAAAEIAARLRAELRTERTLPVPVTASFGIASRPPARMAEELLLAARESLRRAKERGPDSVVAAGDGPRLTAGA